MSSDAPRRAARRRMKGAARRAIRAAPVVFLGSQMREPDVTIDVDHEHHPDVAAASGAGAEA